MTVAWLFVRPRVWALGGVLALAAAAAVSVGAPTAASSAPTAAKPDAEAFTASFTSTTSTHQKLHVQVGAQSSSGIGGADSTVTVSLNSLNGAESHTWGFPVLANAFVLSANGKGKLVVPPASIKPYGVVKLSISPAGKVKKQRCNASAHVTTQKLKVTGTMFFDSHSRGHHSWGQLGSKHKKMTFSGESFEGYGQMFTTCVATTSPCASSLTWSASNLSGSEQFVGGASGKTHGFIFASSVTDLSKPRNSTRSDSVSVRTPAPKLKRGKGNSATLTVPTAGGTATGGGKLASSQPGTSGQVPCGKSKSQTQLSWTASWKNRKPALLLRAAVFGSFKLNNGSQAVIDLTK